MWLVWGQRNVVICDVTCERTDRCSSLWCDLWEDKEMQFFVMWLVERTTSLCPLTSHITKNYISLSSHKELHLFVLSQVTSQRTISLCLLTKYYIFLSSHKSHHKELHLFVLSQVTSQRTASLCPLLERGHRDVVLCDVTCERTKRCSYLICDVTCERTKRCSSLWCDLWEDKDM
jgi:hypothetical protein